MNESLNAMLERAIEVAVVCHAGQVDKSGEAYILHPLRVMLAVREAGGSVEQQAAAVLNDVIEYCGVKDEFLEARFPPDVCDMVDALTRIEGEDDEAFLKRAAKVPGALLVKEACIRDHLDRLGFLEDASMKTRLQQDYERTLTAIRELG